MKMYLMAAAATIALAGPAAAQGMTPAEYVKAAGAGDLFERTSSQIVIKSTADPKVRAFARMMLTAHAKSTAEVKAAALRSHVRVTPPHLTPAQTEMVAQLTAESGKARDATYIAQQRTAHDQALTVQQAYATDGTAPALRKAAAGIVPVVKHHIMALQAM